MLIIVFILIVWFSTWITVWVKGTKEKNTVMVILGGLFTLNLIGLIIAAIQINGWKDDNIFEHFHSQKIEIEKQKMELEKQKMEFQKMEFEKEKREFEEKNKN